ncbi:hypothetical protein E4U55_007425, partial [Claviceps digitariae]
MVNFGSQASIPPSDRNRGQSNASVGLPQRPRNPAQPRRRSGPNDGSAPKGPKKGSGGGGGRASTQSSSNGQAGRRKQPSIRESWGASSRRESRVDEEDDDDDDDDDSRIEREEEDDSKRARKRGRASSATNTQRSSLGGAGVIGRRGIPQPNQPGSHTGQDKRRQQQQRPEEEQQEKQQSGQREQNSNRDASSAPASPPKSYVHVAPYRRRVRQSAIETKWSPLTNGSLTAISATLQHAQRPILQRMSNSQLRREYTSSAFRLITHRITQKISRGLPFPPASMPANVGRAPLQSDGGREVELNFESVLDGKVNLERQLEPALDGLEVLRREKEALETELELDYKTLQNLEAGTKAQAREQRSLLRQAHVLVPAATNASANTDGEGTTSQRDGAGFELTRDEDAAMGGAFT